jgi:SseB protein N-terminal domain
MGGLVNQSLPSAAKAEGRASGLREQADTKQMATRGEDPDAPDGTDTLNPWVYVPAHPVIKDGVELAEYEVRGLIDGNQVVPAFTSVERLIEQLGTSQPWLKLQIRRVIDFFGRDHIAVDPSVDPAGWRWDREGLKEFIIAFSSERDGDVA